MNQSKPKLQLKGIYGLEKLPCGCSVKHYAGGLVKLEPSTHCTNNLKHTHKIIQWLCPVCYAEFPSHNSLKKHKGSHAY